MFMYITYGTKEYLEEKIPAGSLLLEGNSSAAAIYESDGENPFQEHHSYEIINKRGDLQGGGFAVMNHIPVSEEGRSRFEDRFQNRAGLVDNEPGFQAIRILRPLSNDPYIVLTLWDSQASFVAWQQSKAYQEAHRERGTASGLPQNLFTGPSFVKEYTVERT